MTRRENEWEKNDNNQSSTVSRDQIQQMNVNKSVLEICNELNFAPYYKFIIGKV